MAAYDAVFWLLVAVGAYFVGTILWELLHPKPRRRAPGAEAVWLWLGTALLVVAGAVLSVAATVHGQSKQALWASSGFVVAYVLGFLAIVCVVAAIRRVPFPPWARATFPNIEFQCFGWMTRKDDAGNLWHAHRISVFNLESNRPVSLTITYRATTKPTLIGTTTFTQTPFTEPDLDDEPPEKLPPVWMSPVITVRSGHTVSGFFVSEIKKHWVAELVHPLEEYLEILDHASRQMAVVPIDLRLGLQDRRSWKITEVEW